VVALKNEVTLLAHLHHPNLLVFHGLSSTADNAKGYAKVRR
jgi:hypothetical protein